MGDLVLELLTCKQHYYGRTSIRMEVWKSPPAQTLLLRMGPRAATHVVYQRWGGLPAMTVVLLSILLHPVLL